MFLAFLKSPTYNRIVKMTQYKNDSDYSDSDEDEENQYEMVDQDIKYDFNGNDYYLISYESTDTRSERLCKDYVNYGAIGVCLMTHLLIVYVIVYHII